MSPFSAPIAEQIWDMKYRLKSGDGTALDLTVEDSWQRVATALAANEKDPGKWAPVFFDALAGFKFLPAGRILAGAGTDRSVTLFNCFVMGTIPDTMGGIFDNLKEAALTMQQGGGIGYDFSTIRPKGAPVAGVAADASGPLSFMDVWDAMCRTIMSAGSRRGAMMATLRCDHPDIEAFIEAKQDPARLRMFNLSVLITDAFMAAVKEDQSWDLIFNGKVFKTLSARVLWDRITRSTYDYAEPGVIFIDRINQQNNLAYCETIAATNPCGEQPLPPYGACLLGSVNLARLVVDPFSADAGLDEAALDDLVRVAVRMMDNVVDASRFPLPQQKAEALAKRRIGLGVTGLADALLMTGLRYGSDEAARQTEAWMHRIARAAYLASTDLAAEKGAFPLFDRDKFLASGALAGMDMDVRAAIAEKGIRNALLTSVAPTGTISLYAGNVSSGIEPVFAYAYKRKVLQKDGSRTEEEVVDYAVRLWREMFGDAPLPEHFTDAQSLSPLEHVAMQAAAQKWVDSSISKTINCPEDISFADFKQVYTAAWEQGCKGCTTYRPNAVTGSVLRVSEEPKTLPELATVAKRLDWARGRAGLSTKRALAEAIGTSEQSIGPILNGKRDLSNELAGRAAEALRVSAGWLLFGETEGAPETLATTDAEPQTPHGDVVYISEPLDRPGALDGNTYKVRWPDSEHALYITINDIVINNHRRPFEVFINSKNMEHFAWTVALTRMISAVFRRGGDVSFVVEELKAVFDPRGGAWMEGKYIPSILAAIGGVIERHMISIGFIEEGGHLKADPHPNATAMAVGDRPRGASCPSCGQYAMQMVEGCMTCLECGHSKCG
ncbi:MAG: adenosylcobalamin-dependent ribonucleoside-diphosphate reductase [Rhodobacteraceae bacterium]|nr:adenosylcobalamin-dependent ribonucleoside-diphosphate reductase [Paracoccaceae bacterium]